MTKRDVRLAGKRLHPDLSVTVLEGQAAPDSLSLFNVSRGGMFLEGTAGLQEGTPIKLALHFGGAEQVVAHTDVRWIRPASQGPFQPQGLGVRINHIDPTDLDTFENYLEEGALHLTVSDIMAVGNFTVPPTLRIRDLDELRRQKYLPAAIVAEAGGPTLGLIPVDWLFSLPTTQSMLDQPVTDVMIPPPPVLDPELGGSTLLKNLFAGSQLVYLVGNGSSEHYGILTHDIIASVWTMLWKSLVHENTSPMEQGIYRLVHDLRTPLSAIHSTHALLTDGTLDFKSYLQAGFAVAVDSNCRRLMDLTEDMLHLAKNPRKGQGFLPVELLLAPLVADIGTRLQPLASKKSMMLMSTISGHLSWPTSPGMLLRLLENLLGNSVRNAAFGSVVKISAQCDTQHLQINVEDQGEGIPSETLERVRRSLSSVEGPLGRYPQSHGTHGFGLTIVRQLLNILHGSAQVTANSKGGLTIQLTLPRPSTLEP